MPGLQLGRAPHSLLTAVTGRLRDKAARALCPHPGVGVDRAVLVKVESHQEVYARMA